MEGRNERMGLRERWLKARPTKTIVFWSWVACAVLTMIVGFTWGGWVRGATARSMAEAEAEDAVVKHLAPICVVQFPQDPAKSQKLKELREMNAYERGDYVKKHGWAKMPGEGEADSRVADECAKLINQ
ncbi:MAG: hypothetical protein Q7W02_27085 [Candidatus Rokubacteria bacterium]|nr:hypothetical protein [Candidatus Rokubacteria bacterium]